MQLNLSSNWSEIASEYIKDTEVKWIKRMENNYKAQTIIVPSTSGLLDRLAESSSKSPDSNFSTFYKAWPSADALEFLTWCNILEDPVTPLFLKITEKYHILADRVLSVHNDMGII